MLAVFFNHLWQSTLFAGVAGLLTLALGKNRARVRHAVWLAASLKFLIPVSVLIALGSHIEWRTAPEAVPSNVAVVMVEVSQPFTVQPAAIATAPPIRNPIPEVLLGIWACGFIGICCAWFVRWRRVRDAVLAGSVVPLGIPVKVISSPTLLEPGVFGVCKPVLMLPEGIFDRLTPAHLNAVIEHELCHVRHRDNLVATIHMFVETVFWFHPLVWWIGKRMVEERERGCDEEVVGLGGEARVYAEAILNVCKLYVESPLACVAGLSASNLRKRIEQIMANQIGLRLTFAGKVVLGMAAMAAVTVPIAVGMLHAPAVHAQAAAQPGGPRFEVASIKSAAPAENFMFGVRPMPGGRISATNVTLKMLIKRAYDLQDFQISGGQGWIETARYNIEAKPDSPANASEWKEMLKNLLGERFQLALHRETKELPVYALVLAKKDGKLGPGMVESKEGGCVARDPSRPGPQDPGQPPFCDNVLGGPSQLTGTAATVDGVAQMLSVYVGRKVIDKTGLTGKYDITLKFTPDVDQLARWRMPGAPPPAAPADASGPSLFAALQEQLGLKLEPQKALVEIFVVDHAEKPSEN
jgi:bla regulator protein blaR1